MKNITRIVAAVFLFIGAPAYAAPPSFPAASPFVGEVTWSPGTGANELLVQKLEEAWGEWARVSGGVVRPKKIKTGSSRIVFHCSDKFPIGQLDGIDITVGEDTKTELRHVNLSNLVCNNPARRVMLHAVGHALGWNNDMFAYDGIMGWDLLWDTGDAADDGFTAEDVREFSRWYSSESRR